ADARHRLEQVVQRVELEGVDGRVVVGGHEHELGGSGAAPADPGQLEPVEVAHPEVGEDRAVGLVGGLGERMVTMGSADPLLPAAARMAGRRSGSIPAPSSETRSSTSRPITWATIDTLPEPARRSTPWRTAFSTSGWIDIAGTTAPRASSGISTVTVRSRKRA